MRGEYERLITDAEKCLELPPRARRIRAFRGFYLDEHGTTSACAENTIPRLSMLTNPRNYLRVRGEYALSRFLGCSRWELPPRARRILCPATTQFFIVGTTSACAENTENSIVCQVQKRNYLRVRGEYR